MDIHVSLTDDLAEFVKSKVESGHYRSSSEVVEEALRLLEEQDHAADNLTRLKIAWSEGVESGDYRPLDLKAIKAEGRSRRAGKP
ncbi:Putative addiction module antidote protein, CC2985 family [Neorhizobium galegae bv. officinalis bv. officinalis str. HAMBI 1141]|jgi:antitoxin ParD1/3/4|uniref:Putative addiction module antidote protein, CC2985 family n=1 Tax=Neorhizobium galegae bv. officinalis bv. officinalis str. HAMBI 1141 TaxID=1028801 RepID=A0A068TCA4_NEOGA|nr:MULTISPECIES: type II toxin-antitoxin system ParD family antitoxin [Neorhizobium]MCJ9673087.1 type II toxin-antitoxin system ParD family antitoxin [Neorhizobium sp. SHOUNA12B]MCJ9748568.1 type II toxin-antitoxin system ParD family antitoxin [Neorhizobium sp. SHOUNA12A]MCJ9753587.1 type II toxin-antitoxin system ParD family antitoxin [Neorhizobium sp. BETTINA12A]CDN54970.1 Putative addiction module antidote protein, CC2985 family [Neorhizobium galegae bv. officinalis bv. officinalis str. HAMB